MCGIVGILGQADVAGRLMQGLERLEYRGYDSAGIALLSGSDVDIIRAPGKLENLRAEMDRGPRPGTLGIGHTRWATHGAPTVVNAHPHRVGAVTLVHNGIIENYAELREELELGGVTFASETDTEVLACLLNRLLEQSQTLDQACRSLLFLVRGSYAVAAFFEGQPDLMFVARNGSPLALGFKGVGEGCDSEVFVGSDALALAGMCEELSYLEDGDFGYLRPGEAVLYDSLGAEAERDRVAMPGAGLVADKGDWPHFMRKEIEEQPESLERVIYELFDIANLKLRPMLRDVNFAEIDRVVLLACGTAHYACHVASYWIEHFARVPVEIDLASEYRYRNRPLTGRELVVAVSQSGETADTLSAFKTLKGRVAARVGVVNVATSSIAREADAILDILAGPEIGVASTKAFTGQVAALMALALKIAVARKTVCDDILASAIGDIATVPMIVRKTLEGAKEIEAAARDLAQSSDIYFLGRDVNYPIALEAALKLKEISYIHSEAYAAGELKHGPIALIDNGTPVVVFESPGLLGEKTASNVAEVEARGAKVVAVGSSVAADIQVPASGPIAACFAYAAVAQLIAYFVAVEKGTDVDQPRNLAKSVTVE